MKPVCKVCGEAVAPGTLLTHERTHLVPEATPAKRTYVCHRVKCLEVYGPRGHALAEGPHAY